MSSCLLLLLTFSVHLLFGLVNLPKAFMLQFWGIPSRFHSYCTSPILRSTSSLSLANSEVFFRFRHVGLGFDIERTSTIGVLGVRLCVASDSPASAY